MKELAEGKAGGCKNRELVTPEVAVGGGQPERTRERWGGGGEGPGGLRQPSVVGGEGPLSLFIDFIFVRGHRG